MCGDCGGKQSENTRSKLAECCQPRGEYEANPCTAEYQRARQGLAERNPCIGDYERHLYEPLDGDVCAKDTSEPCHIPGYAGHVPTLQSRSGGTYGHDTHESLVSRQQKPAQSHRGSHVCPTPLHEPYRIPGYTGHVPGLHSVVGGTYGHDTHKLLYSLQPYPNRQENLSPFRPGRMTSQNSESQNYATSEGQNYAEISIGRRNGLQDFDLQGTYQKPDVHYYKPQYKYRIGDTYATRADLTLVDPCINKEEKVVISTRELDDTQVVRVAETLEERVQELPYIFRPIRHRPMVPGFDTYMDALRGARGQRFEFSDHTPAQKKLQQQLVLQKGDVRKPLRSIDESPSQNVERSLSQPSNGTVPYGYEKYGERQKYTNSALYDFTSNYRRRQSTEWAPAGISRPDPPVFDIPGEIYSQHTGLLPGYSAHVPGAMFRSGKTFTDDSRDAKRALRGDRF